MLVRLHHCKHALLWKLLPVACALLCMIAPASAAAKKQHMRVSAWYWLNSVPKTQWNSDFKAMKELGLTDVVLVWGFDGAGFASRVGDSREAMQAAYKAGLGTYLFVWHARYSSLPHDPRFEQVDAEGERLYAFDAFNQQWRQTQWRSYLQQLAHTYCAMPGFAGYVFDNSFAIGHVAKVDGDAPKPAANYISYGDAERKAFGRPLPTSPSSPDWSEWTKVRRQGWVDWAKDTRDAIRGIDPNPGHRIVLEDGANTIDPDVETRTGLKLSKVVPYFDTMSAYWAPHYSDGSTEEALAAGVRQYLADMRAAVGPSQDLALTLRLSDDATESAPGHADTPTLQQVKAVIHEAMAMGVTRIDLLAYRMGAFHLEGPGWVDFLPGRGPTYRLTGQVEGKFLADRPELWPGLKSYLEQQSSDRQ